MTSAGVCMSPGKVEHAVGRYAADMENDQTLVTSAGSIDAGSTSVELDVLDVLDELVADELLIEEISIDGMCGVY